MLINNANEKAKTMHKNGDCFAVGRGKKEWMGGRRRVCCHLFHPTLTTACRHICTVTPWNSINK